MEMFDLPEFLPSLAGAAFAIFMAHCLRWRMNTFRTFTHLNIPGPPPNFLWGNIWEIYTRGHLVMQRKWHAQYGPVVGYFFGATPVVLVSDPELLKKILFKDFHNFTDRSELVNGAHLGEFDSGLLVLKGQRWKDIRSILTPSFTVKKLREVHPVMRSCVDGFMENVDKNFTSSSDCDLHEAYQALTLDTICKAAMGVDFKIQEDFRNSKALRRARALMSFKFDLGLVIVASFPILFTLFGKLLVFLNFRAKNAWEDPIAALKKDCRDVVRLRRSNQWNKTKPADLLQLMIDARTTAASATNVPPRFAEDAAEDLEAERKIMAAWDSSTGAKAKKSRGLTEDEVVENALTVLIAGYETTSSSLAFLTKLLLRFPEVQERARAELLEATDGGKTFTLERLHRCQYTEAVIQESLRMYAPVYFLTARVAAADVQYGKMTIPEGINVFSSVQELHYNEGVFINAKEFRPERFLPENRTPAMAASYQPFGAGPRNCIGMRFAQMEIRETVARLLTKYRISSEDEPSHEPSIKAISSPLLQQIKEPLRCKLELI